MYVSYKYSEPEKMYKTKEFLFKKILGDLEI